VKYTPSQDTADRGSVRRHWAGVYIHWPFCERKCPYCDFYTFGREHPNIRFEEAYLEALLAEIRGAPERMGWTAKPTADTVYFGGGTPSLMGPAALERILEALDEAFDFVSPPSRLDCCMPGADRTATDEPGRPPSPTAALAAFGESGLQTESQSGTAVPQNQSCELAPEVNPATADAASSGPKGRDSIAQAKSLRRSVSEGGGASAWEPSTPSFSQAPKGRDKSGSEMESIGLRLRLRLRQRLRQQEEVEITMEVNPTTAEAAQLDKLLALGVNRLSVGSQSFNDRILQQLGRVHDAATTRRAIAHMREAGATNISLDLIFAAPTQTLDDLKRDLDEILAFAPEHVSAYGMTIHTGTPFARWKNEGRLALPGEDAYAAMYETIIDTLAAAGYTHYEISNWARPGRESRHNSKYWMNRNVAAFGVSAHGVWGRRRYENPRDLKAYLARDADALARPLDPPAGERARRGEAIMLALRRVGGATWTEIDAWAGAETRVFYAAELTRLAERGLVEEDREGVRLTRRGLLLADTAMAEFF
jgi:oxygen-independent coproporphyrinogen-3 oxidase